MRLPIVKRPQTAIFKGRRCTVWSQSADGVWLIDDDFRLQHVAADDRDLIANPTANDLMLAEAFETGEIQAFEYPDGHTYPPGREIVKPCRRDRSGEVH